MRLSDFKQVLSRAGIEAEFNSGILWCGNGTIALRRVRIYVFCVLSKTDFYLSKVKITFSHVRSSSWLFVFVQKSLQYTQKQL